MPPYDRAISVLATAAARTQGKTMLSAPYTYTSPDDPAREDQGLFGPGSVTWRVMSNRIMWVAVVRALYLQALHPRVIRGTLQNAGTITQPVDAWARLRRTLTFIEARTFGTTTEAERAGLRVRKIHQVLTGTDPDGTRFRVDEPELLLWVHCGEVASCADIARRSGLPFSAADLDAFVDEQRASAELIGIDRAAAPASMAELGAYYEEMRPRLYACDEAKQAVRLTIHPPVPDGNRVLKLGLPPVSVLAFSTLPPWARRMYGKPEGTLSDMAATAGLRATRLAFSHERLFRGAMRAIHRAVTAGDSGRGRLVARLSRAHCRRRRSGRRYQWRCSGPGICPDRPGRRARVSVGSRRGLSIPVELIV